MAPIVPSDGSSSNDDLHFSVKKKRRQSQGKRWVSNLLALPLFELRVIQILGWIFMNKSLFSEKNDNRHHYGVSSVFVFVARTKTKDTRNSLVITVCVSQNLTGKKCKLKKI